MGSGVFPFGNNLVDRDNWLGRLDTKSGNYIISYEGNFSVVCGYHSFILLGLDSLTISIISLTGCGPSVGLPVGKAIGALNPRRSRAMEQMWDTQSDVRALDGHLDLDREQAGHESGIQLYAKMRQGLAQTLTVHKPFSMNDLWGSSGAVVGAEVEARNSASIYMVEASDGFLGSELLFGQNTVVNQGTGTVSASIGGLIGVWTIDRTFNLYVEIGARTHRDCLIANSSPAYSQPYRIIPNIHPVLAELPPFGCVLPDGAFDPAALLPN